MRSGRRRRARCTAGLLALPEPPTAIVAGVDLLALGVLRGLRDGGRRVPDDVAVVSFDEPGFADLLDPPVTSLDRHDREIGRRAARLLLDALDGADERHGGRGTGLADAARAPLMRLRGLTTTNVAANLFSALQSFAKRSMEESCWSGRSASA